jgi:hypothetical protein
LNPLQAGELGVVGWASCCSVVIAVNVMIKHDWNKGAIGEKVNSADVLLIQLYRADIHGQIAEY